jgi:hypothetical protein
MYQWVKKESGRSRVLLQFESNKEIDIKQYKESFTYK